VSGAGAPSLLVFFGLPGAGKTFAARRLAARRGFHFHDGDEELPDDMREAIARAQPVTPDMRDRFAQRLIDRARALTASQPRVVLAQTFLKAVHRARFLAALPEARFVLITAPEQTRLARLAHRTHQPLEPRYAQAMTALFDEVTGAVTVVENGGDLATLDAALDRL
jgi:gluconate kinase